jgi:deazaflavin-dependent oxidoreductase (nitroreductase family)
VKDAPASRTRGVNLRWLRPKPNRVLRLAFRLPIYLYRLNLGWLLGHRFLLLVHRGRSSGLLRETVLEVLLHDPATRESVVLSAWGEKADWCRNIELTPALEVQTGGQRYVPEQRFLAPEENHPLAFRVFAIEPHPTPERRPQQPSGEPTQRRSTLPQRHREWDRRQADSARRPRRQPHRTVRTLTHIKTRRRRASPRWRTNFGEFTSHVLG